jgi:hypothetical protein
VFSARSAVSSYAVMSWITVPTASLQSYGVMCLASAGHGRPEGLHYIRNASGPTQREPQRLLGSQSKHLSTLRFPCVLCALRGFSYAMMSWITLPDTSVNRKSRPL